MADEYDVRAAIAAHENELVEGAVDHLTAILRPDLVAVTPELAPGVVKAKLASPAFACFLKPVPPPPAPRPGSVEAIGAEFRQRGTPGLRGAQSGGMTSADAAAALANPAATFPGAVPGTVSPGAANPAAESLLAHIKLQQDAALGSFGLTPKRDAEGQLIRQPRPRRR